MENETFDFADLATSIETVGTIDAAAALWHSAVVM
jgi:hypothetical protein